MDKPIGFLQEDFHSEVLSFLLELINFKHPNKKMIIYNHIDRYNNICIYENQYKNLQRRDLQSFLPDLNNNVCEYIFVISYDNVINFLMLLNYTNNLIFIAHSSKHIDTFKKFNVNFFSLTNLLSNRFMLPISKVKINVDVNNFTITENMETIKYNNLEKIIMVGSFFENNKDLKLLSELLNTQKYNIILYTTEISDELKDFVDKYPKHFFVGLNISTSEVLYHIKQLDVKYLLFCPNNQSNFYTSSWSGCIQFALEYDIHLILPKLLANIYGINNHALITYESLEDIDKGISSGECLQHNYNSIKESIFARNTIVYDIILGDIKTSNLGHFKINYHDNTEILQNKVNQFEQIINKFFKGKSLKNTVVLETNPEDTIFSLTVLLLEHTCNVKSFINNLDKAKYYKNIFVYNCLQNRIAFYNGSIGLKNYSSKDIEIYPLDNLEINQEVSVIYTTTDTLQDLVISGEKTIITNNPIIIVNNNEHATHISDNKLINIGYIKNIVDNHIIYTKNEYIHQ